MASTTSIQSSTASMNAAAPTMETQMQQVRYADSNQTRGAAQLRDGDPMDFGVLPYARDPYDERARIIRDIAAGETLGGGPRDERAAVQLLGIPKASIQRTLPITSEDIEYVHRWEAQQQEFMFDKWIMSQFDMSKPAERDRVMKLFPRYHQRQKALVDSKLALMKKWIEIQMFGIRSEDDGRFLFNVYAGVIQLPQGYHSYSALTDALNPLDPDRSPGPYPSGRLEERGWFNPLRYIGFPAAQRTSGFNPTNPAYPMPIPADEAARRTVGDASMGGAGPFFVSTNPTLPNVPSRTLPTLA